MKSIRLNYRLLYNIIVICFIILFAHTGISKLTSLEQFTSNIARQPFPAWLKFMIVPYLPILELILAGLMCFDKPRNIGLLISTFLMGAFTVYAYLVVRRHFGFTPCSCGGIIEHLNWPQHLAFNSVYTLLGLIALRIHYKKLDMETYRESVQTQKI